MTISSTAPQQAPQFVPTFVDLDVAALAPRHRPRVMTTRGSKKLAVSAATLDFSQIPQQQHSRHLAPGELQQLEISIGCGTPGCQACVAAGMALVFRPKDRTLSELALSRSLDADWASTFMLDEVNAQPFAARQWGLSDAAPVPQIVARIVSIDMDPDMRTEKVLRYMVDTMRHVLAGIYNDEPVHLTIEAAHRSDLGQRAPKEALWFEQAFARLGAVPGMQVDHAFLQHGKPARLCPSHNVVFLLPTVR